MLIVRRGHTNPGRREQTSSSLNNMKARAMVTV